MFRKERRVFTSSRAVEQIHAAATGGAGADAKVLVYLFSETTRRLLSVTLDTERPSMLGEDRDWRGRLIHQIARSRATSRSPLAILDESGQT
jgi:hypothetical protein